MKDPDIDTGVVGRLTFIKGLDDILSRRLEGGGGPRLMEDGESNLGIVLEVGVPVPFSL